MKIFIYRLPTYKMDFLRTIVLIYFFVLFTVKGEKVMSWLNPGRFPALYNFGDSNSDTGTTAVAFNQNPFPYGITFFKRSSGRSCDGRLIIDFIADQLRFPYLSAYLDSIGTNFKHGANFAAKGALARGLNEYTTRGTLSPFSLDVQVEQFVQFKERSSYFFQQSIDIDRLPDPGGFANALYIIDIGQTDISYAFATMQSDQQIIASFRDIVKEIDSAIKKLYQLKARNFGIFNVGPIGCLPRTTKPFPNLPPDFLDTRGCIKSQNTVTKEFNQQLKEKAAELAKQLGDSKITYVDIYTAKYELISNHSGLGFFSPSEICCGTYTDEIKIPCAISNGTDYLCYDPREYIMWDGIHYTEASNSYIANQLFNNASLSD